MAGEKIGIFTIASPPLDMAGKMEFNRALAGGALRGTAEAMEKHLGKEKAVEIWTEFYADLVVESFKEYCRNVGYEEKDYNSPIAWANFYCWFEDQGLGCKGTVVEVNENKVLREATYCPWGEGAFKGWDCRTYLGKGAGDAPERFGVKFTMFKCQPVHGMCEWSFEKP